MNEELLSFAAQSARFLQDVSVDCCQQFFWMTIAAGIFGFLMACGIGANDVANAFATSVSAKSVTLKQAVVIAGICEFLGAMLLGASVTSTIKGKMIDTSLYADEPGVLMYGMLTSLVAASFILAVANYLALPVSTTHTIVGSIVGFSLAAKGFSSIDWMEVGKIFISWVAAPVITGSAAALFFWVSRKFILLSQSPYKRAITLYPFIIFIAIGVDLFMVFYKAGKNSPQIKEWGLKFMIPAGFCISLFLAIVFHFFLSPYLQKRVDAKMERLEKAKADKENEDAVQENAEAGERGEKKSATMMKILGEIGEDEEEKAVEQDDGEEQTTNTTMSRSERIKKQMSASFHKSVSKLGDATINRDIEAEAFAKSTKAKEMWETGEEFDPRAEEMFSHLQVLTACLLSFAHGANDVANAIGPIAAVIAIYNTGEVSSKNPVPKWIIFLGAAGIVIGLLLYGYKLMISLGYKITKMSPSRGFCIELAASFVVVIASFIGIPVSTTQCQVGGTIGVGLIGGEKGNRSGNLNPLFVIKVILGWVGTFVAVCVINAGVFAFAYYAPSASGFA
uniref:Phosphate transporter n=1 Tax=Skeletonema tropicum TaxID=267982 RepID=A0A8F2Z1S1_9STRA|nr:Na+/Pi cotransporter [Skeletonema tropicum]